MHSFASADFWESSWKAVAGGTRTCNLQSQRHLDLRFLSQPSGEAPLRGVVSSCSVRGGACCLQVELQRTNLLKLSEKVFFGMLTPCSSTQLGIRETGVTPARTRQAVHPCRSADALWRQKLASGKPSGWALGDLAQPLPGAPPRDDRGVGCPGSPLPSRCAPSSLLLRAWTRGSARLQ